MPFTTLVPMGPTGHVPGQTAYSMATSSCLWLSVTPL